MSNRPMIYSKTSEVILNHYDRELPFCKVLNNIEMNGNNSALTIHILYGAAVVER